MSISELRKRVGGAALTLVMVFGIGIMSSTTAQAQWRNDDRYNGNQDQVRWTSERNRQYAFMLGYHNAYTEGKDAAERGYRGSPRDMAGYRNSNNGHRAWMGSESTYRDNYRKGYEQGFRDGQTGRSRRYDRKDIERVLGGAQLLAAHTQAASRKLCAISQIMSWSASRMRYSTRLQATLRQAAPEGCMKSLISQAQPARPYPGLIC
jgi:hypothetical protein